MAMNYSRKSDNELLMLLNKGDHKAFTEVYERYWQVAYAHAYRMLGELAGAEDLVQDLFTTLWNRTGQLDIRQPLKSYLFVAIRNRTLKSIRQGKRRTEFLRELAQAEPPAGLDTHEAVAYAELARLMEGEVGKLPSKMQEVFRQSREEALSHREIARKLNISENSVKTTINRALKVLRTKLPFFF